MEEIRTSFNGKDGNGGLTLYANPFGTGKKFYGRFERDVLSMENLVSRIQEKNPGADEIIINTGISYIKREILAALKEGKAVNLLDLGELYVGASGSVADDSAREVSELTLTIKFSASQVLKDSISNVSIGNVVFSNTAPAISKIFNWYTGEESTTLTAVRTLFLRAKGSSLGQMKTVDSFLLPPMKKERFRMMKQSGSAAHPLCARTRPKRLTSTFPKPQAPALPTGLS